ncbi:MAG: type II secretion system protein N [Chakrabartia godavariana]
MISRFRLPLQPRTAWSIFGALALLLMLMWLLPLSVVIWSAGLGSAGLSARTVDGTAWSGRMHDAVFKGTRLGDLQVRLSPLDLLFGTARLRLQSLSGGPVSGEGYAGLAGKGLYNVDARLTLGPGLQSLGLQAAQVTALTATFNGSGCVEASGQATVYIPEGNLARAVGPQMSGPASCVNGTLVFRVTDPAGKGTLAFEFAPTSGQRYTMLLPLSDALDRSALKALGFTETPVGFRRSGTVPD